MASCIYDCPHIVKFYWARRLKGLSASCRRLAADWHRIGAMIPYRDKGWVDAHCDKHDGRYQSKYHRRQWWKATKQLWLQILFDNRPDVFKLLNFECPIIMQGVVRPLSCARSTVAAVQQRQKAREKCVARGVANCVELFLFHVRTCWPPDINSYNQDLKTISNWPSWWDDEKVVQTNQINDSAVFSWGEP